MIKELLTKLAGKTVWLTGGRRIGQTVALALADLGMNILVTYRGSRTEAELTAAAVGKKGVKGFAFPADVSRRQAVEKAIEAGEKHCGRIDYLVQMASIFSAVPLAKVSDQDWHDYVDAHVKGLFWPAQSLAKRWQERGTKGKIILFTDRTTAGGGHPYLDHLPYIVTKGAAQTMVKVLARELGTAGILVNAIAPGPLLRPPTISETEWQAIRREALLKDITDEEAVRQVVWAVVYLLAAELTTGQTLVLDSGFNLL